VTGGALSQRVAASLGAGGRTAIRAPAPCLTCHAPDFCRPWHVMHARTLACESPSARRPVRAHENGPADRGAGVSVLGCQLRPVGSLAEGSVWAAGRSLPGMSLAFALMAAINGSTGSSATLSHGL
jgi:hypothetical protein